MEISRERLSEQYINQGLSIREVAKLAHCKRDKIKAKLDEYGITRKLNPATCLHPATLIDGIVHKRCSQCKSTKPLEYFRKDSNDSSGYKARCIPCDKIAHAFSRRRKDVDLGEYIPNYQRVEHKRQQSIDRWRSIRPMILFNWLLVEVCGDEIATAIKTIQATKQKVYYRERYSREKQFRKEKLQEEWRKRRSIRRARLKAAPDSLTNDQWIETLRYFDYSCCYCGSKYDLVQDHIVPLVKGGGYVVGNIVPACNRCNNTKGYKNFGAWYQGAAYFDVNRYAKVVSWQELCNTQDAQGCC